MFIFKMRQHSYHFFADRYHAHTGLVISILLLTLHFSSVNTRSQVPGQHGQEQDRGQRRQGEDLPRAECGDEDGPLRTHH